MGIALPNAAATTPLARAATLGCLLVLSACHSSLAPGGAVGASGGASASGVGYLADIRSGAGLARLAPDAALERAALQQAAYMAHANRMAHTTGRGKNFSARLRGAGVRGAAAENIAHGTMGADELFSRWMASSGHRRNMLDPRFRKFGLAYASRDGRQRYWALVLGE